MMSKGQCAIEYFRKKYFCHDANSNTCKNLRSSSKCYQEELDSKKITMERLSFQTAAVMFSLPAAQFPREKSRVPFISAAGQLHLVVIKETFARVLAARGKRPQCTGINICQRAQLGRL
ncbi:hypothetical protein AVEN_181035-1 [Araneus ventricosus]|uniref:Uncharacterized protein n=1 Tax=Araneus ventricosus TaxID=182803 RepID=A0A4Y2L1A8_ARAVE|nr:hypothetical protein AVEN_181035-1 [Araneus ventricosus]